MARIKEFWHIKRTQWHKFWHTRRFYALFYAFWIELWFYAWNFNLFLSFNQTHLKRVWLALHRLLNKAIKLKARISTLNYKEIHASTRYTHKEAHKAFGEFSISSKTCLPIQQTIHCTMLQISTQDLFFKYFL